MKRLWLSCVALALIVAPGFSADLKSGKSFGSLEPVSVADAKAQALGWLRQVNKADAATLQKVEAVWQDESRTILDRVVETMVLADPAAAKLLADARDPAVPAPMEAPKMLRDAKAPIFYRANLGLAYARTLSNRRVHEEALETLKLFHPEQVVDPSAYLFHRAVSEHALLQKPEAVKTIARMIDDVPFAPDRYRNVSVLMLLDMQTWKDKDLSSIARKMENIERRLELARGGPQTQKLQKEVVLRLDELIKELENKQKGDGSSNGGS